MRHFTFTPNKKLDKDTSNTETEVNLEEKKKEIVFTISQTDKGRIDCDPSSQKPADQHFRYVPKKVFDHDPEMTEGRSQDQASENIKQTEGNKFPMETMQTEQFISYQRKSNSFYTPQRFNPDELDIVPVMSLETPNIATRLRIEIKWDNVNVRPKNSNSCTQSIGSPGHHILYNVSGSVRHGQFLSLMGTSGAGKTTLLQYLSSKMFPSHFESSGNVYINKKPRETIDYNTFTAFVQQDDILMEMMTIRECLEFAAAIRRRGTKEQNKDRIDDILAELELANVEHLRVNSPLVGK